MTKRLVMKLAITLVSIFFLLYSFGVESLLGLGSPDSLFEFNVFRLFVGFFCISLLVAFSSVFLFIDEASGVSSADMSRLHVDEESEHGRKKGAFHGHSDPSESAAKDTSDFYGNLGGVPAPYTPEGEAVYGKM